MSRHTRSIVIWFAITAAAALGVGACKQGAAHDGAIPGTDAAGGAPRTQSSRAKAEELTPPYPRGRWRLAPLDQLSKVVLWTSHVLIRHADVVPGVASFQLGDWAPAPPAPARTRKEAFEYAQQIAEMLQGKPEDFARAAAELSEDVTSRERGGSLGGICAADLYLRHANVLDVLAAIRPGELSRVVETVYGFHVFLRRPPPPQEAVSGSRIVIGYDEAPWLHAFLARRALPPRSRAEALALASRVYARAQAGESFEALVEEFSDHQEAVRQGDFGEWSTHERVPFPAEVELLQQLEVGEVAPPLDSPIGFEIIKRSPKRTRALFAMTTVQQAFDHARMDSDPTSRVSVLRNMEWLAREVAGDPARFAELQQEYCCSNVEQWYEGQGPAAAEKALEPLLPGQVALAPVQVANNFAIVRRMTWEPSAPPVTEFELPAPERPDLQHLARRALINYQLPEVGRQAREVLGLEEGVADRFLQLHESAFRTDEAEREDERESRFVAFLAQVRELVGSERYGRYAALIEQHFERRLLADDARQARAH